MSLSDREQYLEAMCRARREGYKAKQQTQHDAFAEKLNNAGGRGKIFKTARRMVASNRNVVGQQCVRSDQGDVVVNDEDLRNAWKEHYEEFYCNRGNLEVAQPVQGPVQ